MGSRKDGTLPLWRSKRPEHNWDCVGRIPASDLRQRQEGQIVWQDWIGRTARTDSKSSAIHSCGECPYAEAVSCRVDACRGLVGNFTRHREAPGTTTISIDADTTKPARGGLRRAGLTASNTTSEEPTRATIHVAVVGINRSASSHKQTEGTLHVHNQIGKSSTAGRPDYLLDCRQIERQRSQTERH